MGGYVTRYENDFDYLTIRGSGHMVPEFKPAATVRGVGVLYGAWVLGCGLDIVSVGTGVCHAPSLSHMVV